MLAIDSKDPMAYAMKAIVLAACPDARIRDGKKALELAKKACELGNWDGPFGFQALAKLMPKTDSTTKPYAGKRRRWMS